MKKLSLMEIVKAVYAVDYTAYNRFINIENIEFDSRKLEANSLFIPLTGGTTDGHDYIQKAIEQGAVATLWSRPQEEAPTDDIAVIFVDNTLEAFQKLATYYRQLINPTVIGITGSNGKTTTKDMTANVLTAKYKVHKTEGNYNNEIGLPDTLLHMPEDTEVVVLEMGMSGFNEIELLSQIAQPDIVAITLIGESHMEFLGSKAGIAQAKLEILAGLKDDGLFIYPGNEPLIQSEMPDYAPVNMETLSFGMEMTYDVYAYNLVEEQDKTYFNTNLDPNVLCMIPVMGAYNVSNALIALSISNHLQVPMEQAIFQLAQFKLTKNRLEWLTAPNGMQVLNDAYNASPTSMLAVLKAFSQLPKVEGRRKIAILGDIRELGEKAPDYHRRLQIGISSEELDQIYLFGPEMAALFQVLQSQFSPENLFYEASDHSKLIDLLQENLQATDQVLVKSSLGVDLLKVVTALTGHETENFLRQS